VFLMIIDGAVPILRPALRLISVPFKGFLSEAYSCIWLRDPKATATVFILRLRLDGNALSKCRSGLQRVARVRARDHSSANRSLQLELAE
jgi:hypothetical protein